MIKAIGFLDELDYEPITRDGKPVEREGADYWRLNKQLRFMYSVDGSVRTITVPAGFELDFASIPVFAQCWFKRHGRYSAASAIHDWLYHNKLGTRADADKIFLEAMVVLKVPRWKRNLFYRAVRIGGGMYWNG